VLRGCLKRIRLIRLVDLFLTNCHDTKLAGILMPSCSRVPIDPDCGH